VGAIDFIQVFAISFTSLFAIVNPVSTSIIFVTLSEGSPKWRKQRMAMKAAIVSCGVLLLFAVTGMLVLNFFGITTIALQIAGGIYIVYMGFRMIHPHQFHKDIHPQSRREFKGDVDVSIIPIAIPFLSGPGAITTTILIASKAESVLSYIALISAIIAVCIVSWILLAHAHRVKKLLGTSGMKTLEKVMGLIVLAIGVQFILNGLQSYGVAIGLLGA